MADPLSSGAAQVAEKMLEEVKQASQQAEQLSQAKAPAEIAFDQVLEAQRTDRVVDNLSYRSENMGTPAAVKVLTTARAQEGVQHRAPPVPAIGRSLDQDAMSSGVQRIMEDVMQGQNKLEEIINLALSGRSFSTPELLALQAGVYRFTQELELTSKVVEKGTATIKQTMNTQV